MMESGCAFQDDAMPWGAPTPSVDKFDDDLFSAALLFLDQPYGDTDSDSHSIHTADLELFQPQEQEPFCETKDASRISYDSYDLERELKIPRTSSEAVSVKLEPMAGGSVPSISALWEPGEHSFHPTGPRRVNKRKEEISVLRVQAAALQARVNALNKQPLDAKRDPGMFNGAEQSLAWQSIASRQLEQRKQAENENRRLKELAAEHRRVAKALKRIAARHSNSKSWDPFRSTAPRPQYRSDHVLTLDAPGITEAMLASVEQMLEQTDSMLSDNQGQLFTKERHGDSHLTIQLQDCRLVPFGVATTAAAVWNYTLLNEDIEKLQWTPVRNGSFQSEFVAFVDLGEFQGHAEGKIVVRRVDEAHRTVIVRHSVFHCLTAGHRTRFMAVPMRHFLWTVIDRPPQLNVPPGRDAISRIRTCAVSLPRLDVGDLNDPTREEEIDDLVHICTTIATQQCEHSYDVVDNILLGSNPPLSKGTSICQAAFQRKDAR